MKTDFSRVALCLAVLPAFTVSPVAAQSTYDADRQRAFQLIQENNLTAALPLLEKLAAAKPDDTGVLQFLGLSVVALAVASNNPEQKKQAFRRARELAEKCKTLGDNNQLVQTLLDRIPTEEELNAAPKKNTPAEEALQAGEAAFGSGDFKTALAEYERAEKLDSKLYEAPLFVGDIYYKLKDLEKAGAAYARAIAINPDRDTAYRFWGNVLLQSGRMEESRQKLIEAVICEPYSRAPWQFLSNWAQRNQVTLGHPRIEIPTSVKQESGKDGKTQTNITLDANLLGKKDGTRGWLMYGITRSLWMNEKFLREYPNEKTYRHSLREETEALRGVIEVAANEMTDSKDNSALDPSIANLVKLNNAGLLEAYVLFAMADEGIARDYLDYRKTNRDKLRRYMVEFMTAK